jgi:hypothetical protein
VIVAVIAKILKVLSFLAALAWFGLIVVAQQSCSIIPSVGHQCNGPEGDVWTLPFFYSVIGPPALIASITIDYHHSCSTARTGFSAFGALRDLIPSVFGKPLLSDKPAVSQIAWH